MYQNQPDIELINNIKNDKEVETSLEELINRHGGLFTNIQQRFENYNPAISGSYIKDVADDMKYIFYNAAKEYNPDKNTKFSTYLGNTVRFICLKTINNKKNNSFPAPSEFISYMVDNVKKEDNEKRDATIEGVVEILDKMDDKRIPKIFKLMYLNNDKKLNFKTVGKIMNLSGTTVKHLHDKALQFVRIKLESL